MNRVKKSLAILLSVMLSITILGVSAAAEGTASGNEALTVSVTTDREAYAVNDTVTVNVSIENNYNLTAFRFPVMFDSSVFELGLTNELTAYNNCKTKGTIGSNNTNDGSCIPEEYDSSAFGCVVVQWTASVVNATVGCINNPNGELCFSFKLKAKSSAAGKTGSVFIPPESDLFYYQAIQDPTDATTIYYMSAETLTSSYNIANASVIGETVKLIPNSANNSNAVIDETNLWVYGLQTGLASTDDIKQHVSATANSTLRCEHAEYGYGTGTKINLWVDNAIVRTYDVVIFGDVNGDANVDAVDVGTVTNVAALIEVMSENVIRFAADVNGDNSIDSVDAGLFASVAAGIATINQVEPY